MTNISKFLSMIFLILMMVGTAAGEEDELNMLERAYVDYYAYDSRVSELNGSVQEASTDIPTDLETISDTGILATSGADLNITKTDNTIVIDDNSEYQYIYDVAIPYADIEKFVRNGAVQMRHIRDDGIVDAEWLQAVDNVSGYVIFPDLPFSTVTVGFSCITIDISGSSPDGYQIPVTIPYKSGMSNDFANIRFFANSTSYYGGTEISYWVQNYTASTSAYVWLPIPAGATKIYCEWGISGETTSESNISKVMLFGDDFKSGSSKWKTFGATLTTVDGRSCASMSNANGTGLTSQNISNLDAYLIDFDIKFNPIGSQGPRLGGGLGNISYMVETYLSGSISTGWNGVAIWVNGTRTASNTSAGMWNTSTWYHTQILSSNGAQYYNISANGVRKVQVSSSAARPTPQNGEFNIYIWDAPGGNGANVSDLMIRLYDATPITATVNATVTTVPISNFTSNVTSGDAPITVQFNDTSTNNPTNWTWDFGDGETSTERNPTHTYYSTGTHIVQLTAANMAGYSSTTHNITILNYMWDNQTSLEWMGYTWSLYNDTDYSSDVNSIYVDTSNRLHMVLRCIDDQYYSVWAEMADAHQYGTYSWTAASPSLNLEPETYFYTTLDNTNIGIYTGRANNTDDIPLWFYTYGWYYNESAYDWQFKDLTYDVVIANTSTDRTATDITYTINWQPSYITWTATRSDGTTLATHTTSDPAVIPTGNMTFGFDLWCDYEESTPTAAQEVILSNFSYTDSMLPIVTFSANTTSGEIPLTVQFTDESTGSPTRWLWDFGDGSTSTLQNPTHTYNKAGIYTVSLIATTSGGSVKTTWTNLITATYTYTARPVTSFKAAYAAPLAVQFTDTSTNATAWNWNFGDGNTSTEQNPVHTYAAVGTYEVNLTATNPVGSNSSIVQNRVVKTAPNNYSQYKDVLFQENMTAWDFPVNMTTFYTSFMPAWFFWCVILLIPYIGMYSRQGGIEIVAVIYLFTGGMIAMIPGFAVIAPFAKWFLFLGAAGILYKVLVRD